MGDCDGSGNVTVDELIRMVNVALGAATANVCAPGDRNGDGAITIDELVAAVNRALSGCPSAGRCTISFVPPVVERGGSAAVVWSAQQAGDCVVSCDSMPSAAAVQPEGSLTMTADDAVRCILRCTSTSGGDAVQCGARLPLAADCPVPSCAARVEASPEGGYQLRVDSEGVTCAYSCPGAGAGALACDATVSLGNRPHDCRVWAAGACGSVRRCSTSAWSAPVTLDGSVDDWVPGTRFPTMAGANYVSWDAQWLYFAVHHPALARRGDGIAVTIYLGNGMSGAGRSLQAGTQSCVLPVPMSYAIRWRPGSGTADLLRSSAEGSWVPERGDAVATAWSAENAVVEFSVRRSALSLGAPLFVHIDMADDRPGHESTFGATPPGSHLDGYMEPGDVCAEAQQFDTEDWGPPNTQPTTKFKNFGALSGISIAPPDTAYSLRIATFNGHYVEIPAGEPDMDAYINQVCTAVHDLDGLQQLPFVATEIAVGWTVPLLEIAPLPWDLACPIVINKVLDFKNAALEREAGGALTNEERAEKLALRILGMDLDVVVLNEIFDEGPRDRLVSILKGKYPYIVGRIERPAAPNLADLLAPHLGAYYIQDSGLMLFSRYPFDELSKQGRLAPDSGQLDLWWQGATVSNAAKKAVAFIPFSDHSCREEDCNAGKGAGLVRIGKNPGQHFAVAFSHTQASYGSDDAAERNASMDIRAADLGDIRMLIEDSLTANQMNNELLFVLGDLNIVGRFPDGASLGPATWPDWDAAHESFAGSATLNSDEDADWDLGRQEWLHHFCGLRTGQPGDPCHNADPGESYLQAPAVPGLFACGDGTRQECAAAQGAPVLVDSWAYDTSPHDMGRSEGRGAWLPVLTTCSPQGDQCFGGDPACDWPPPYARLKTTLCSGERLDYILHNQPMITGGLTPRRMCAQHMSLAWELSGAPGFQPLSDHIPVRGDFNLWFHHCRPREAKVVDANLLEQLPDNTFTATGPEYQIAYPGSMQWFRIDEPGSYSIGISDGFGFTVYTDEDLSNPKPSYHRMESEWGVRYQLANPPYYVRVFATDDVSGKPDREKTGPSTLTIHRHKCTSAADACVVPAGSAFRAVWPDKHFTSWDPADLHHDAGPDALWFIFTTYGDDKKKLPYLSFEYEGAYIDNYSLEVVEYCGAQGPCPGPHQIVRDVSNFSSGPAVQPCEACEFATQQLVVGATDVEATSLFFNPGPTPSPSPQGTRYFLRVLRAEPLGIYGTDCTADPCGALENERTAEVRYGTNLTFFFADKLKLTLSEDDWGDYTDELWYSFQVDEASPRKSKDSTYNWLGYFVEGEEEGGGLWFTGVRSYVDNLQPNIYSAAEPNATIDDTDPAWFVPRLGNYFCYPGPPAKPERGLCPLADDEITSRKAHPTIPISVVYSDDWAANPDDADYLATMTFCLMHEYPDRDEGQWPTVQDCYGWE